jgi:DNA-binding MarR family transcriptional regulator
MVACVQATVASSQQLAAALALLSGHINRTASPDMFRVLGEVGLSFTQMKTLFVLEQHDEMSVKDVSGHLAMSFPAMSRSIDGLVQRGYVTRRECASDRRSKLVALLPAGRDVLGRIVAARETALTAFAEQLSESERNALHAALLPIVERISSP